MVYQFLESALREKGSASNIMVRNEWPYKSVEAMSVRFAARCCGQGEVIIGTDSEVLETCLDLLRVAADAAFAHGLARTVQDGIGEHLSLQEARDLLATAIRSIAQSDCCSRKENVTE